MEEYPLHGETDGGHEALIGEEVVVDEGGSHHEAASPMDVSGEMFLWTLFTFSLVAVLLSKIAWKPILAGLDNREETIRKSMDDAEKIRMEMAALDGNRRKVIADADDKAKEIVGRSRQAGMEAERVIKDKARQEAGILIENASREINAARDKAAAELRKQSVETALALAGKLIGENLDEEKQRRLTDRLISQL